MGSVADAIKALKKEHNKEDTRIAMASDVDNIDFISTGVLAVDAVLGGGFPRGRIVDIYGAPGGGKTAICQKYVAEAQKFGPCVWVDLENSFDPVKAESAGINLEELILINAMAAEDVLDAIESLLGTDDCVAIVVDSWAGLTPRAELAGDVGDSHVGLVGRLSSQFLRKSSVTLASSDKTLVCINQERDNIGSMGYGPTKIATGGKAIKFWASTRLEVSRVQQIKQSDDVIGQKVQVKAIKTRLSKPQSKAVFDLLYETGIDNEKYLIDLAVEAGIFTKAGNWFTDVESGEKYNGQNALASKLREDKQMFNDLKDILLGDE